MASSLRIGILVDTLLKQQYLTTMVAQSGHQICFRGLVSLNPDELPPLNEAVDAWIIDTAEEDMVEAGRSPVPAAPDTNALEFVLEHVSVPVILDDSSEYRPGSEEHGSWLRRMALRLQRLSGDINLQQTTRAPYLWILAASTGGPAAVKEFLSHLPENLGVAFVYVQHIDTHYAPTLLRMMSGAGHYPAVLARHGDVLRPNTVFLVTAEQRVEILENGTLCIAREPWSGCYAPSIDQVAANSALTYRERSGLIIFTGMGDDGAASCRLTKQQGGQVWVQTPDTCTSPSMPEAALATQCVNYSGTPSKLAQQLAQHMNRQTRTRIALP